MGPSRRAGVKVAGSGRWAEAVERLGWPVAAFCVVVAVAAGVTGVVLLVAPGATARSFSWTLRPDAAAAIIGGLYLASAVVFAWALTLPWRQVRPLLVGALGLAVPTFLGSVLQREVFDFGRWQAVAWVVLFAVAPVAAAAILATRDPDADGADPGLPLAGRVRSVLAAVAVVLLGLALAVWFDGSRDELSRAGPVALVGLTGAYLGAWCSYGSVLAGWAAVQGRWDDARVPLVALAGIAAGVAVGVLRTLGDVRRPALALAAAALLGAVAVASSVVSTPPGGEP